MDLFERIFKEQEPILALENFLKVKAPDIVEKDAMYYNEKGEGYLDTFYKTNPEPVRHENGKELHFTNDRGEVFRVTERKDYVLTNQKRPATTEEDFQEVYKREFERRSLDITPEIEDLFRTELIEQVQDLIRLHKEKVKPGQRDIETIGRANRFLAFLKHSKEVQDKADHSEEKHPQHDPNLWNRECYELFKHLYDEYCDGALRGKKTRIMNVWFYLSEYDPDNYHLKATKDQYIDFIKENYEIKPVNKDKSSGYEGKEFRTINEHRENFEELFLRKNKSSL